MSWNSPDIAPATSATRALYGAMYTHFAVAPGDVSARRMHISAILVLPELVGILMIFDALDLSRPPSTALLWDGHISETERWPATGLGPGPLASSIRYRLHAKCPARSPRADHVDLDAIGAASARRPCTSANSSSSPDAANTFPALASPADAASTFSLSPVRKKLPSAESDEAAAASPSAYGRSPALS